MQNKEEKTIRSNYVNLQIKTVLKDENNNNIKFDFDFLDIVGEKSYYFKSNINDYVYFYYDAIKVKAITLKIEADVKGERVDDDTVLIYNAAKFLEDYYYNLQRFEASLFWFKNKPSLNHLRNEKIGNLLNENGYTTEKVEEKLKEKDNLFTQPEGYTSQLNYFLSNIFIYYHYYYIRYLNDDVNRERNVNESLKYFKNTSIIEFEKYIHNELNRFIEINQAFVRYLEDVNYYVR